MSTKLTSSNSPAFAPVPINWPSSTPASTTQERLLRIQNMNQRISGHVQFMCGIEELKGISTEAKERSVLAFYEQMRAMEQCLDRIQEALRLA
jgi:hypothetical protein